MENQPKLLVIEQNDHVCQICKMLQQNHFDVTKLSEGHRAIELLKKENFDLVLTSIYLSDVDGVEIVTSIHDIQPDIPVIIMSRPAHEQQAVKALYAGACHFIREPLKFDEVLETVKKLLRYRQEDVIQRRIFPFLTEKVEFTIPSDLSLMGGVVKYIFDALVKFGLQQEDDVNIKIALLEALTNAIEHGNKRDSEKTVFLQAKMLPNLAKITIRDQGSGFNYQDLPDPMDPKNITKIRGRGIFMIYNLMDEVSFNEAGNQITMIKYRHEPPDTAK
ncbi:ATP-binding protein [bacterium]|nr:ATP-binding protein [bacterium]